MTYNGSEYFYLTYLQDDVTGLADASGATVVSYTYDTWGKLISTTGSMATTLGVKNPFRYRGYRYDTETGLYYLQSRYYNPEIGRFISTDTSDTLTATPMELTDKNHFSYCDNNTVMRADVGGEFWHIVAGAAIGGLIGGISSIVAQAVSGQKINLTSVGISAASGALTGAITATCPGMGVLAVGAINGAVGASTYAATEKFAYGRNPKLRGVLAAGIGRQFKSYHIIRALISNAKHTIGLNTRFSSPLLFHPRYQYHRLNVGWGIDKILIRKRRGSAK